MKTKLVRPVLLSSSDIDAKLTLYHDGNFNHCELSTNLDKLQYHTNQRLILISLDPNEKIEVGDVFYSSKYNTIDTLASNGVIDKLTSYKVIATQDQLSPYLINQLVDEYNNGGMQDFEIEMHNNLNDPERICDFNEPYMPNGFVTVVEKESIMYSEEDIRKLCVTWFNHYYDITNRGIKIVNDPEEWDKWFNQNKKK